MILFASKPKKFWPGSEPAEVRKRLENALVLREKSYQEVEGCHCGNEKNLHACFQKVFLKRFGFLRGTIKELVFVEKATRDFLPKVTRLGNFWPAIRFAFNLFSIAGLITFSGGTSNEMRILHLIQGTGIWLISEQALVKACISSNRFGLLHDRLGISFRKLVISMYLSVWIEFLTLICFCNAFSLISGDGFLFLTDYLGIVFGFVVLSSIFSPIGYSLSIQSRRWIDVRYIVPLLFRAALVTTPLFLNYHKEFPLLERVFSVLPTTIAFCGVLPNLKISTLDVFLGLTVICILNLLWFLRPKFAETSCWIESDEGTRNGPG